MKTLQVVKLETLFLDFLKKKNKTTFNYKDFNQYLTNLGFTNFQSKRHGLIAINDCNLNTYSSVFNKLTRNNIIIRNSKRRYYSNLQ